MTVSKVYCNLDSRDWRLLIDTNFETIRHYKTQSPVEERRKQLPKTMQKAKAKIIRIKDRRLGQRALRSADTKRKISIKA